MSEANSWLRPGAMSPTQADRRSPQPAPDRRELRSRRLVLLLEDLGGGTGNHLCGLLAEWILDGWEVRIITQSPPLVRHLPPGAEIEVVPRAGWYDRFPLAQLRRLVQLRRIVREWRPDVVHTYFFWSIVYGRTLKWLGYVPALVENREDMGFSWGRGAYAVLRATRTLPDRIICVAEAVRDVVLDRERVSPGHAIVIHNGVDRDRPSAADRAKARHEFGFQAHHVVIGMVANLPRLVKGGHRLLDAVGAIITAVPSARFLLVGVGTDRQSLEGELRRRGIFEYVVGAGYRSDVERCYGAMDISVLTSSSEGLSITVLESMHHGLPTVVTDVGGNREAVVDGVTGFVVPLHEQDEFVRRVVLLAGDARLRLAMGSAGRERAHTVFSVRAAAHTYLGVYRDLMNAVRETE